MARYTNDSRERVRDAVDFAELVGARTELRQAGPRRMTGLCPFHDERTPSFGIDPVEKLYHCFGCGEGGDVFKFVMETEGLDFTSALESLAGRFGVELEREAEDPQAAVRRERSDRLLALLERTAAYYVRVLWESDEADAARSYLAGRGLSEGALREFRVGYSPSAWDRVLTASQRAGYSVSELMDAGLAVRGKQGGVYDRFRGRIMFPLADERGRVRGFGARAMRDGQGPKYLNSNEGEVFHKGRFVYGADLARAAAAREGRVALVEGYTDVIALHQAGVAGVVGSMGTALTRGQVEALSRLAPTVLFCLDADAAGQEAMARAAQEVRRFNADRPASRPLDFRIVPLPAGTDPADVVGEGADALRDRLDGSVEFATFLTRRHLDTGDLRSAEGRDRVIEALRPTFAELPDGFLYHELLQLVSDRLDSPPDVLARYLPARGRRAERPPDRARAAPTTMEPGGNGTPWRRFQDTERAFLARCLAVPEEGRALLGELDLEGLFTSELTRRAAQHLREHFDHPSEALPIDDDAFARLIAELVINAGGLGGDAQALELERLQLELLRLNREIHAAERGGEPVGELARERQRVHEEIRHRLV
jgi:DNA primase